MDYGDLIIELILYSSDFQKVRYTSPVYNFIFTMTIG